MTSKGIILRELRAKRSKMGDIRMVEIALGVEVKCRALALEEFRERSFVVLEVVEEGEIEAFWGVPERAAEESIAALGAECWIVDIGLKCECMKEGEHAS